MRFLSFHCDYFRYKTTKKSRSKILEELDDNNREGYLEKVIVLFIAIEKQDETNPSYLEKSIKEIKKITYQLKITNLVLLSFAHLFGELSSPEFGFNGIKELETELKKMEYTILRPPFGWFNELEFKAKGHPLSRMSRQI